MGDGRLVQAGPAPHVREGHGVGGAEKVEDGGGLLKDLYLHRYTMRTKVNDMNYIVDGLGSQVEMWTGCSLSGCSARRM